MFISYRIWISVDRFFIYHVFPWAPSWNFSLVVSDSHSGGSHYLFGGSLIFFTGYNIFFDNFLGFDVEAVGSTETLTGVSNTFLSGDSFSYSSR